MRAWSGAVVVALRRRDPLYHRVEEAGDALAGLGGDAEDLVGGDPEHALDLGRALVGLGGRQVDLVERGHDREVGFEGRVAVGEGLGLDPLARVDEEDGALARRHAAGDLVPEVDVAGRVDEVEDVVLPREADVLRLDGDAALPLEIHRVQVLGPHVPELHGTAQLEEPIGQGALAVVDVGDDGEVAEALEGGRRHCPPSLAEQASPPGLRLRCDRDSERW